METNDIDPAFYTVKEPGKLPDVTGRIIQAFKKNIFEGDSSLAVEIEMPYNIKHLSYRVSPLDRHQHSSFLIKGGMKANGKMASAFFKEFPYTCQNTNGADCDPGGAPAITPITCQDFEAFQYFRNIIKRLTHTHVNHIGQLSEFRQTAELVKNFIRGKIALKALLAGHTEYTPHFTARLR